MVPDALKDNLKWKGTYYGVPMNFATLLLYYNKTIFTEAGLDPETPPATWDELEQYAEGVSGSNPASVKIVLLRCV